MEQEQTAEIAAIQSQIQALRQERASFAVQITPLENDSSSPQAIVQLYRRQAQENAELFAQLKGIDDAIAALEALLTKKTSPANTSSDPVNPTAAIRGGKKTGSNSRRTY